MFKSILILKILFVTLLRVTFNAHAKKTSESYYRIKNYSSYKAPKKLIQKNQLMQVWARSVNAMD